jgi:hypothetical protein
MVKRKLGLAMEQTKSYPDRIRGLATDIDCAETMSEYDFIALRLRRLADELEEWLKQVTSKTG